MQCTVATSILCSTPVLISFILENCCKISDPVMRLFTAPRKLSFSCLSFPPLKEASLLLTQCEVSWKRREPRDLRPRVTMSVKTNPCTGLFWKTLVRNKYQTLIPFACIHLLCQSYVSRSSVGNIWDKTRRTYIHKRIPAYITFETVDWGLGVSWTGYSASSLLQTRTIKSTKELPFDKCTYTL